MRNKLLILLFFLLNDFISAQCAMCRAVLESSENEGMAEGINNGIVYLACLLYTSPSPRDLSTSRMPSSA